MEKARVFNLFFSSLIIFSLLELSEEADILTIGGSVRDGETLVSSSQTFELGFFSAGKSKNRYFGIWFKNRPGAVVWVANRKNPIVDGKGFLTVNNKGNLVLLNHQNNVIWSSNVSKQAENPVAQLLDTGNFVVKDNKSMPKSYLWESFDYPSDTLLAGMKIGWNLKTGEQRYLTSWKSADDPSPGSFTLRLDINGSPQLVLRRGSMKKYRTGPWNGVGFGAIPMVPNLRIEWTVISNENELYHTYEAFSNKPTQLWLNQSGYLQRLILNEENSDWSLLYSAPFDQCDRYGLCGANSICSIRKADTCECLAGSIRTIPKSQEGTNTSKSFSMNCVRESSLDCQKGGSFQRLAGVKVPDLLNVQLNKSMSPEICESECFKNCSCTAYANMNVIEGGSSCLMWFGDLIDLIEVSEKHLGEEVYIRLPAANLGSKHGSRTRKRSKAILLVSIISIAIISGLVFSIIWKKAKKRELESGKDETEVPLFDLSTVENATNNFSSANLIGEGGFGPVYKGNLPTGQEIAVKRLSKDSRQGDEQFRNEVVLIAKLQHRNLVGLLACCIQGDERMLVYEFMPNKSLDHFIFDHKRSGAKLSWQKRFDIVLGIARGLLYLHQDSKLQIIHRDLKASNILLDSNLTPKISDFGLARIFGGNDEETKTNTVVGTYGYMAPEYAIDGTFSVKSDVFAFGVILLEIVSGKKNRGFNHPDHCHNLLGHAWLLWKENRALELTDTSLEESCVRSEVVRFIHVGLLCVQEFPEDRPAMSSVLLNLTNEEVSLREPNQPGFFIQRKSCNTLNAATTSKYESNTENLVTITMIEAR